MQRSAGKYLPHTNLFYYYIVYLLLYIFNNCCTDMNTTKDLNIYSQIYTYERYYFDHKSTGLKISFSGM